MPIRLTPTSAELDQPTDEQPDQASSEPSPGCSGGPVRVPFESSDNVDVAAFRRSRYEEYDHTDLLHVIDELEGSRNWVSLREKLWIALIIHMLIAWYLFYGPKYLYHVRVVDPSVIMKQRQKDLTFLDLPPDLLKQKPKPSNILSDKDRVAQAPHPTIDKKTLEELEAMRRAGEPKPAPAPRQPVQGPPEPAPQQAQQRAPSPPAQPLPQNNQARMEAPPMAPQPHFSSGPTNPNEQLTNAMRDAMHGGGQYSGDEGQDLNPQHQGINGAVQVLSDTMGWDYGPYVQRVIADTKRSWYPIIPEEARPPLDKRGKVMVRFRIQPDGTVTNMQLEGPSGDVALDRAAWGGITGAAPFPPIPKAFKGPYLELRFYFLYNIRPGDE
ncbi:MAG TPA: TonB family protein [Acidobacteriaceae bacterium]|jgi:TonB family protein|nr:TonB family protein [Acidobacteriaceae bacterium]